MGPGLGLTLFVFAAVNGYILRTLPFPGAERLGHLEAARPSEGRGNIEVSLHDFVDYRRDQRSLDSLAAFYAGTVNLSGDQTPERYDGAFLTANAFRCSEHGRSSGACSQKARISRGPPRSRS